MMRSYIDMIAKLYESTLPAGDVEGQMTVGPIHFDQKNGIGNVPDSANIKYMGFACLMTPRQFLRLAEYRDFSQTSSIEYLVKALEEGKPIGSPFLSVNFDNTIPVVRQHEGRTRMAAIQQVFPDSLVLVHVFPSGGERARHLSLDQIAHFREQTIPQKSKTPLAGPHCDNTVWWLDGWKSLP